MRVEGIQNVVKMTFLKEIFKFSTVELGSKLTAKAI